MTLAQAQEPGGKDVCPFGEALVRCYEISGKRVHDHCVDARIAETQGGNVCNIL